MTHSKNRSMPALMLAAIGVVYGDIGTSPLYTLKEVFAESSHITLSLDTILGVISTIVWCLVMVVTLKYVSILLRVHHHGEGGILTLTHLAAKTIANRPHLPSFLIILGIFGATFFYGDSIITPAISVLGAIEGLSVIHPKMEPWIVPISVLIIITLFVFQKLGTNKVGKFFGPIIVLWFVCLGIAGLFHIFTAPVILKSLNPYYAFTFLAHQSVWVWFVLGAIILALTGAEALYADLGHFGRKPIQYAWLGLVMPSLILNYMGQGALLLHTPSALQNPFYFLFPNYLWVPMIVLATLAAIIASQAVISGAYSMTQQAIQLGWLPRLKVVHTSVNDIGQIYLPKVNSMLLVGVVLVILMFRTSGALAAAYGIAVTITMLLSSILLFFILRDRVSLWIALPLTLIFIGIDTSFVIGCALKFFHGGWFPVTMGFLIFLCMKVWHQGREQIKYQLSRSGTTWESFFTEIDSSEDLHILDKHAVYIVSSLHDLQYVPPTVLRNIQLNQTLYKRNILVQLHFHDVPIISFDKRVSVTPMHKYFWCVDIRFGFKNILDIPSALTLCKEQGLSIPLDNITYFVSKESVENNSASTYAQQLFATMFNTASSKADFLKLPEPAVIEMGHTLRL